MDIVFKSITPSTKLCDQYVCHSCIALINQVVDNKLIVTNMPLKTILDKKKGKFEGYSGLWRKKKITNNLVV